MEFSAGKIRTAKRPRFVGRVYWSICGSICRICGDWEVGGTQLQEALGLGL